MSTENKMYVGNLEYSVTEDTLRDFFASKGFETKDIKVIKDKYSGRSKGFGFVEVESDEVLQKAIEALNGQELNGRALKVNKAQPPQERGPREGRSRF